MDNIILGHEGQSKFPEIVSWVCVGSMCCQTESAPVTVLIDLNHVIINLHWEPIVTKVQVEVNKAGSLRARENLGVGVIRRASVQQGIQLGIHPANLIVWPSDTA